MRILVEEHHVTELGPTRNQWEQDTRYKLVNSLLEQIAERVGTAVPHFAHKGEYHMTAKGLSEELREGVEAIAMIGSQEHEGEDAPSGRTATRGGKKQPREPPLQGWSAAYSQWWGSHPAQYWWTSPSGEASSSGWTTSGWTPEEWDELGRDYREYAREAQIEEDGLD